MLKSIYIYKVLIILSKHFKCDKIFCSVKIVSKNFNSIDFLAQQTLSLPQIYRVEKTSSPEIYEILYKYDLHKTLHQSFQYTRIKI